MTAPRTTDSRLGSVEPLAVSPRVTSVLLNIGLSKTYELIRSNELESYLDGKNRKVTMRSIKARIARLLTAHGPSTCLPPWRRGSKQTEQAGAMSALSSEPPSPPPTDSMSAEPPPRRRSRTRKTERPTAEAP
jgi:hypothetical protein